MITAYKIPREIDRIKTDYYLTWGGTRTKGHGWKLSIQRSHRDIRKKINVRVVNKWNVLGRYCGDILHAVFNVKMIGPNRHRNLYTSWLRGRTKELKLNPCKHNYTSTHQYMHKKAFDTVPHKRCGTYLTNSRGKRE